jgi:hypothetical protein
MIKYILILMPLIALAKNPAAEDLLKRSDRARGGVAQGVTWNATLTSVEEGETSERKFTVKTKGDNALVELTAPARNKGEKFLFNDTVMWFHKPSLRKPVSVSARQRNSGQAANGDIASIQYARDYSAKILGKEKINGDEAWILELKAKNKSVTYDQIKYWISVKNGLGVKAEFLTLQGAPFKRAQFVYNNQIQSAGKTEPFISEMIIQDATFPDNKSILKYEAPTAATLSDSMFNVNNISR